MKKLKTIVDKLAQDKYHFIIRRLVVHGKLDEAVDVILDLATINEPIREIPFDWWAHFKLRWFPKWLKRKFPPRMVWVVAVHRFPELQVPDLGREYISLKTIDPDKLVKEIDQDEPKEQS